MPDDAKPQPNAATYRLASHPDTPAHAYEVGRPGADLMDPTAFEILAIRFSPLEAQAAALAFNAEPPHPEPHGEGESGERLSRHELEAMTKDELVTAANERDIELVSHATKSDVIDAIMRHQRSHKS